MKIEKYFLRSEPTQTIFWFRSEGPNGIILKEIYFQPTSNELLFNLAFGDMDPETGDVSDLSVSNNGDTEKVLGTVVMALYAFLKSTRMRWCMQQEVMLQEHDFTEWA